MHGSDFYESIAPGVMRSLERVAFFEKLDDLLSPRDQSTAPQTCRNSFQISESILPAFGFTEEDVEDILGVLRSRPACCDCEIVYNVADSSRLKAKYWRSRAAAIEDKARHPRD